jgi:hypothetical protein
VRLGAALAANARIIAQAAEDHAVEKPKVQIIPRSHGAEKSSCLRLFPITTGFFLRFIASALLPRHSEKFDRQPLSAFGSPGKAVGCLHAVRRRHYWMGAAMRDYLKKAEECVCAAHKMRDPAERIEMLGIARGYMSLADHAERDKNRSRLRRQSELLAEG